MIEKIKEQLEKEYSQKILIKNIVKKENIAGIAVEYDGKMYDHSLSGKYPVLNLPGHRSG